MQHQLRVNSALHSICPWITSFLHDIIARIVSFVSIVFTLTTSQCFSSFHMLLHVLLWIMWISIVVISTQCFTTCIVVKHWVLKLSLYWWPETCLAACGYSFNRLSKSFIAIWLVEQYLHRHSWCTCCPYVHCIVSFLTLLFSLIVALPFSPRIALGNSPIGFLQITHSASIVTMCSDFCWSGQFITWFLPTHRPYQLTNTLSSNFTAR